VLVTVQRKAHRILIVDDDEDCSEVTALLLGFEGYECRIATTGRDALDELERFGPDIVLLDIGLPDLTGYEVAIEMRARAGADVYLAALTGWSGPQQISDMIAAGFDQQVIKPTDYDKLRCIVLSAESCAMRASASEQADIRSPTTSGC